MAFGRNFSFILLAIPLLFSVACTRPQSEISKMQIVLPAKVDSNKVGSQSLSAGDSLRHVVINVSGDGFTPIVFTWDACHDCQTPPTPPSSFSLDIPMGSNRLIQVLAVYKNQSSEAMSFYYGDTLKSLAAATESAIVPISALGGSAAIVSGNITGRYLTAANEGPTGPVDVIYTPPGKPPVIIERSQIVNGWFQLFGLAGLPFGYRLPGGSLLFGKALDLNDPVLAASQNVLRLALPTHDRQRWDNLGNATWMTEEAFLGVVGYFGPGLQSYHAVCKPSTMPSMTGRTVYGTAGANGLTPSSSAIPSAAMLLDTASPLTDYYVNGGASSSFCTSTFTAVDHYVKYMDFDPDRVDQNGKDEIADFRVPFEMLSNGYPLDVMGDPFVISGQLLPGVESVVQSFALFKRPTADDNFWIENPDCSTIASGANGFTSAGTGTVNTSDRSFSVTSNITSTEASSGVSAVLCPIRNGVMASRGVFMGRWIFMGPGGGGGGGGGPAVPATDFQIHTQWHNVVVNQCHELSVELTDGGNWNVTNANTVNIAISTTGLGGYTLNLFSDATCSTSMGSSITLNPGEVRKTVRFKFTGSGTSTNASIDGTTSAFGPSITQSSGIDVSASSSVADRMVLTRTDLYSGGGYCEPVDVFRIDAGMRPSPSGGAENVSISMSPAGTVGIYLDGSCTTPVSSFTYNASEFYKRIFVKRLSGSGETVVDFTNPVFSPGNDVVSLYMDPASFASYLAVTTDMIDPNSAFGINDCIPLKYQLYDNSNSPITGAIGGSIQIPLFGNLGGNFYGTESDCRNWTGWINSASVGPATGSTVVWYRGSFGGALTISAPYTFRLSDPMNNADFNTNIIAFDAGGTYGFDTYVRANQFLSLSAGSAITSWLNYLGSNDLTNISTGTGTPSPAVGNQTGWKSLQFAGSGSAGDALMQSGVSRSTFTLALSVRFASTGANEGILQFYGTNCDGTSTAKACRLQKNADNSITFLGITSAANVISDTNFHTIVVYRDSTNTAIFVDGGIVATGSTLATDFTDTFTTFKLGYTTIDGGVSKTWLNGEVGEVLSYPSNVTTDATFMSDLFAYFQAKFP